MKGKKKKKEKKKKCISYAFVGSADGLKLISALDKHSLGLPSLSFIGLPMDYLHILLYWNTFTFSGVTHWIYTHMDYCDALL